MIAVADLIYKEPTVRAGVVLKTASDLETRAMPLSDFDYRLPSAKPGESKPIVLDEAFYSQRYPGLPDNAAFALARASLGMKAKQIRSEWKKAQKRMVITRGPKIVSFD